MPHSTHQNSNDPLLGGSPKLRNDISPQPLSSTTQMAIKALSVIRIALGAACIVAPRFTCSLFKFDVPGEQALFVRMFGVRDAVIGELLITADDKERGDGGRRQVYEDETMIVELTDTREIRRAIWASIAADVVDFGSLIFGVAVGQTGKTPGSLLGAAAVGAIGLGAVALRGL